MDSSRCSGGCCIRWTSWAPRRARGYRKSARVVGDTMGKYHPHGDSALYDALVRMAQPFSLRYPLVDGQGNFGSVDGDPAAAKRYTETRLTAVSAEMLDEIDRDTVNFVENFDGTAEMPEVLPSVVPNLLLNGATGIAVGMATSLPPHNLREVGRAIQHLLDTPDASQDDIMKFVKGPDFPTAAVIIGAEDIQETYRKGRGRVLVRARVTIEEVRGERMALVVTELPYMINKATLIERIADLVRHRTVEGISDLRDESDRHGMRAVIELKRDARPSAVLNQLYKHTALQSTFSVNMLALVDGRPEQLTLKRMIEIFIRHRQEVIRRRTTFDLKKARVRGAPARGLCHRAGQHRRRHQVHSRRRRHGSRASRVDAAIRPFRDAGQRDFSTCNCAGWCGSNGNASSTSSMPCGRRLPTSWTSWPTRPRARDHPQRDPGHRGSLRRRAPHRDSGRRERRVLGCRPGGR